MNHLENSIISRLEKYLDEVPGKIKSISEDDLLRKPEPSKWSKKEIMGHLVDSAIYNIIRFTQAQYKPSPFVIEGYEQDNLVRLNNYQDVPLDHILKSWVLLNRQVIFILSRLSEQQLGIQIIRKGEEKTLGWLAKDYLNHMEHHLKQVMD